MKNNSDLLKAKNDDNILHKWETKKSRHLFKQCDQQK